ncbi:MFS transporter [Salinicola peritrichatus]|uniref:MFS transporter n=1 Tax=Salinicola peritrichatus TaxID=1267424 RepID=UPI000DA20AD4|nr:MFS transporter [Salinicola peritrichatus]
MWRLVLLSVGAFVAQTSEYLPISVMPAIQDDLSISEAAVGGLVTGYAWIAALSATPLTMLTARWDRKTLFLSLLGTIAVAGSLGAVAPSYELLAASRVLMALAHGVFWAMLAVLAVRLAPRMPRTQVLAVVFAGISLAGVAGVPLCAFIAQTVGWRWAFAGFASMAAALSLAGLLALPGVPSRRMDEQPPIASLRDQRLRRVVAATTIVVAGHFCAYTYIVPLLEQTAGMPGRWMPALLFVFGMAGALGVLLSGWLSWPAIRLAMAATAGIAVSQACFGFAGGWMPTLGPILALWGASSAALVVGLQGAAIDSVPDHADMASAFYVAAFNIGIGAGAMVGGLLTAITPFVALLWVGAALATLGLLILRSNRLPAGD